MTQQIDLGNGVPKKWRVMRLKGFSQTIKGKSVDYLESPVIGSHVVLTLETLRTENPPFLNYAICDDPEQLCKSGDIIVIWDGAGVGEFLRAKEGLISSTTAKVVLDSNIIDPRFFWYFGDRIDEVMKHMPTGMGVPHLDPNIWANLEFAIPPLAEQCHIADYLDEKISSIDFYISGRENELKLLKLFKQSRINEVVVRGLKRDAEFIECGIDWLGIIPRHWRVRRIKDIFYESTELTSEGNEDLLSVSEYYGVAKRKERMDDDEEFESRAESLEGYKICHKGDLVSNIMLTWKRALGVSEYDGIVSPAYGVYRGIDIFPKYYHYLFRSDMYIAEFKRNSTGIIDSRLRLYSDKFFSIHTIYPPLSEQEEIANYLDEECEKIDRKYALIEEQIKQLQLLKRALINEVVTGKRKIA